MNLEQLLANLDADLQREVTHWHFYKHSSMGITGIHRPELREFFQKQADEESSHIDEFAQLILGLGGKPSTNNLTLNCPHYEDPRLILEHSIKLEQEVVKNYTKRIQEAEQLEDVDPVNSRFVVIFLEEQLLHSRQDLDEMTMILKGLK